MFLEVESVIYPTTIGHYNMHYPDWKKGLTILSALDLEVEELPLVCFEDKDIKAFRISPERAEQFGLSIPVIWTRV